MSLTDRLYQSILQTGCIPPASHGLVAVSGGADSVALLSLLHRLSEPLQLTLEAAHLDHQLRDDSATDAQCVASCCSTLGLPLTLQRTDVAAICAARRGNLEEVGRSVRREFLLQTAAKKGCDWIALGHHADDQAETFLMNLLRGGGTTGLAGMRRVNGRIVRPLLSFSRQELRDYLAEEGLPWRDDPTNRDPALTRSRIRHQLLPMLASYNPNISRQLADCCQRLRHEEDFWDGYIAEQLRSCGRREASAYVLDGVRIAALPPAVSARLIRAALHEVRGHLRQVNARHIEAVIGLLKDGPVQGELDLPGVWVARRYDSLWLSAEKPRQEEFVAFAMHEIGRYPLANGQTLTLTREQHPRGETARVVEFAATDVSFPLLVRQPRPGDRLHPSGMSGTKKLQDVFVDRKLPKEERRKTLLVYHQDELLWVVGMRRCEGRRPRPGEPVLRIALSPQNGS